MKRRVTPEKPIIQSYSTNTPDPVNPTIRSLKTSRFSFQFWFSLAKLMFGVSIFAALLLYPPVPAETDRIDRNVWGLEKEHVAKSISAQLKENEFPKHVQFQTANRTFDAVLNYNFQPNFKQYIDDLLAHYRPDFAAVVAIQPDSGRILALSSFVRDGEPVGNLAVHSGFPAASIFKIVTATAVIDQGIASPTTTFEYNGKDTSLYKKNVLRHKKNKWTRTIPLSYAFARSINTVFGRMGVFHVGGAKLIEYAENFGFNKPVPVDFIIEASRTRFDADNDWSVAEAASGYTRTTTISPMHAAMLAAAIANDGVIVEPRLIDYAHHPNGPILYDSSQNSYRAMESSTAQDMRVLMRETVKKGSARKSFRGFFKGKYADLDIGGKTGSLTGTNPKGRTEWFVGYGDSGVKKVAIAAVVVNKEKWRVKPSYLARKLFEEYFKEPSANG